MDPTEPMPSHVRGGLLGALPGDAVDRLLAVAGPGIEVPLVVAELRLMGGALSRPAPVPNAVAGREGAFALTVIAPAPPPLLEVAPLVTAGIVDALEPWSTGTSLVNFSGNSDGRDKSAAWTPQTLDRLRRVKQTVDPRNVFGGALGAPAPAGAR
jgi:hypothetical protein